MVVALANARMTAPAPTRHPRRFGLFSVAEVVDGGTQHWMLGGLRADAEDCSKPSVGTIGCAPSANKSSRSWYSDAIGDPWLTYMFETCKTVGRFSESEAKTRTRFLAAEQSSVELGFQTNVLKNSTSIGAAAPNVTLAIAALEAKAAAEYGGEVTLHLPFVVAEEAVRVSLVQRFGDHLETVTGTRVSVGNYQPDLDGGSATAPVLYITGEVVLHRSDLTVSGPVFDRTNNDYFVLVERAYGALIDCFSMRATATLETGATP